MAARGLGGLDDVGGRHAAHVVAVNVDGQANFGVERLHHALGAVGGEHARHVLDADGVGAQVFQLLAVVQIAVQRGHRRHGVGDGAFEMPAALLDGLRVVNDVADVVQGVEHAEHVHAVALGGLDEAVADLARVMLVAHEVLPAREHGKRRVRRLGLDGAQALHGFSSRKRMQVSNVAPPHASIAQYPTRSIFGRMGSMSPICMRVAHRLCWPSRMVVSMI